MKADVILKKKEDAVSPVIGVMLMLVVTIVIAAVVAAFAGGLATETESLLYLRMHQHSEQQTVLVQYPLRFRLQKPQQQRR